MENMRVRSRAHKRWVGRALQHCKAGYGSPAARTGQDLAGKSVRSRARSGPSVTPFDFADTGHRGAQEGSLNLTACAPS